MRSLLPLILSLTASVAMAQSVVIRSDLDATESRNLGEVLDGYTMQSGDKWLDDWMATTGIADVCFDLEMIDADNSTTSVTMRCETTRDAANTADDAGFDVCSRSTTAGVSTYTCPHDWTTATGSGAGKTKKWKWCVTKVGAPFLNCLFTFGGAPDATIDLLHVDARAVSP